jgi:hypothetical protein
MIEREDWQWLNKENFQQQEFQNDKKDQLCFRKNSPTRVLDELREGEGPYLVLVLSMRRG